MAVNEGGALVALSRLAENHLVHYLHRHIGKVEFLITLAQSFRVWLVLPENRPILTLNRCTLTFWPALPLPPLVPSSSLAAPELWLWQQAST